MGSWWAVIIHGFWFGIWLTFDFSLEALTLWVSLEAIFIGIFLLMAANKAEVERDRKETRERNRQRKMIGTDIAMDHNEVQELTQIKKSLKVIEEKITRLERATQS